MSNPTSTSSKTEKQRPQKPKSAAQRASDANREQQMAVRANRSRPSDRTTGVAEHDENLRPKR
jgi:hypothetical protein